MLAASLGSLVVLIARNLPSELYLPPCLEDGYYGLSSTGSYSFYITDIECTPSAATFLSEAYFAPLETDTQSQLVWFEQVPAEPGLPMVTPSFGLDVQELERSLTSFPTESGQEVISDSRPHFEVLHYGPQSLLVRMDRALARQVDTHVPPYWKTMILPGVPMSYVPVPSSAVERVKDVLAHVRFNPVVASVVNKISIPQMQRDIRYLTGEDAKSPIVSRHSFSDGALVAADWLKARFEETGAHCHLKQFLDGFAPNVIWSVAIAVVGRVL